MENNSSFGFSGSSLLLMFLITYLFSSSWNFSNLETKELIEKYLKEKSESEKDSESVKETED